MKDTMELVVNILLNNIDVIIMVYLCCSLVEKQLPISIKGVTFGLVGGTALGIVAHYLDGYEYKALVFIFMMIVYKLISQKKIRDLAIIYIIVYLCVIFIQIPVTLIVSLFPMHEYLFFLITQIISLVIVLLMCKKLPLYKLFYKIERDIVLQLVLFALAGIFLAVFFYFNFEYENMRSYVLYFSILIGISIICLYKVIKELFFYTRSMPAKYHDMKNIMVGLYISVYGKSDINVIRAHLDSYLDKMDIDAKVEELVIDDDGKNILSFIQHKKYESNKKLNFITDVRYYEPNEKVDFPDIIYMLGLLLDNAIEASNSDKPIFISVHVMEEGVEISVANVYKRQSVNDFEKMFQEGYTTKSTSSRGYGLPNLSKIVKEYGGDIFIHHNYNEEQKSSYLTIRIEIKN